MTKSKRGLRWLFRVYKIYALDADFNWESKHAIPRNLYFYDEENKLRMAMNKHGRITIKKRYSWDGCTPKFSIFDLFIFGIPDGINSRITNKPKTYYASLVHDALYQFLPEMDEGHGITRRDADAIFRNILIKHEFALSGIYWFAVRALGGIFMQVRKHITRNTNGIVKVSKNRN